MGNSGSRPVALVTGGASGIGRAFGEYWMQKGGRVVIADLNPDAIASVLADFSPDQARGISCDVTSTQDVERVVASIRDNEGRLDTVVNSAGVAQPEESASITDHAFQNLLNIHVTGTMRVCREAYPLLKESHGAIVNLASVAATMGMPQRASYGAAKVAITGLTRTLAVEWGPAGVRVNAVAPGYVRTALTDSLIAEGKLDDTKIISRTALGRFAAPEEIAAAIYFLASADSSFVNGHTLFVDGGLTVDGNWY